MTAVTSRTGSIVVLVLVFLAVLVLTSPLGDFPLDDGGYVVAFDSLPVMQAGSPPGQALASCGHHAHLRAETRRRGTAQPVPFGRFRVWPLTGH